MGIKDFTKTFDSQMSIKYAQINAILSEGQIEPRPIRIAIDAMNQIHRSATWKAASKLTSASDARGTAHILVTLAVIHKAAAHDIKQIWVFDHPPTSAMPTIQLKTEELQRRRERREQARKEVEEMEDAGLASQEDIDRKKREAFSVDPQTIGDIKFILDAYNIPWVEAPNGRDGEALCAMLTNCDNPFGICDAVLSDDTDTLVYGSRAMLKRSSKKNADFDLYKLDDLLRTIRISYSEFIKIGVILGSDFAPKTKGVGPKTVLRAYKSVTLTDRQKEAVTHFMTQCDMPNTFHNIDEIDEAGHRDRMAALNTWLAEKGFSKKTTDKYTRG